MNLHSLTIVSLTAVFLGQGATAAPGTSAAPEDQAAVTAILQSYVDDYRMDPAMADVTFGIEVEGAWWTVTATPGEGDSPGKTKLKTGAPDEPTFYFTLDRKTLGMLDRGELNAETAMVKEFSTDPSPMDLDVMEGFEPGPDFIGVALPATFHFWTRGLPEFIPFGESFTRHTHGADAAVFYYQPGFRSGWGSLKKGQHANANPASQTNPFPSMFIIIKGQASARIGGKEVELKSGRAVLVPAGVSHEFWNNNDAPMEFILLMFGEGA